MHLTGVWGLSVCILSIQKSCLTKVYFEKTTGFMFYNNYEL